MKRLKLLTTVLGLSMMLTACGGSSYDTIGSAVKTESTNTFNSVTDNMGATADVESAGWYDYDYSDDYYNDYEYTEDYAEDYVEEDYTEESIEETETPKKSTEEQSVKLYETKLVYRCNMEIETLNYDESYAKLKESIKKYDCIIESENYTDDNREEDYYYSGIFETGKYNVITIRVPSYNYEAFLNENGNIGNILEKQTSVDNITQKYYDTTAQIEGLEVQLERLKEMLSNAYEVEDMITINKEITTLEYTINSLKTEIRTMDMDTAYSYVTMVIKEVVEYTQGEEPVKKNTFVDRLKNQIRETWEDTLSSLEDLLFWLIDSIPALVVIGIAVLIVIFIKKSNKGKKSTITEALEIIKEAEEKEKDEQQK